jgi:hypothetical protein
MAELKDYLLSYILKQQTITAIRLYRRQCCHVRKKFSESISMLIHGASWEHEDGPIVDATGTACQTDRLLPLPTPEGLTRLAHTTGRGRGTVPTTNSCTTKEKTKQKIKIGQIYLKHS